jgi:selenide,water dikinase
MPMGWADAALFELSPNLLLVSSVDFGTPTSSSAAKWGRIAALNALSDLYAMGARPHFGLSILGWPANLNTDMISILTRAAADALSECSAALAGGHTITSDVPLFGLAVTGTVDPNRIMRLANARPGDLLILTKPIGTGIVVTAVKGGVAPLEAQHKAEAIMMSSNRQAAELAMSIGVDAATDITGYGLIGHLHNMLVASGTAAELDQASSAVMPEALAILNDHGTMPNIAEQTYFALEGEVDWGSVPIDARMALCDPQTSGGLMLATRPDVGNAFMRACETRKQFARVVGRVVSGPTGHIRVSS